MELGCRCTVGDNVERLLLRLMVDHYEGRKPDPSWIRWPGWPRRTWLHHIQQELGVTTSTP